MTDNEATTAGAVDRLAGLVDAADGDKRARRRLLDRASRVLAADAQAERRARSAIAEADQRARSVEANADARIRAAEARLRVQEREREANKAERDAGRAEQAATREARAETSALRRARWTERRTLVSAAAPASLSMLVYLAAVASAVFGQVSVATGRYGWSMLRALLLAGFIELMALAMATTANWLRLRGERALAPRVLTWVFAGFAATVNIWGHSNDPLMAAGLGAASLGGITLWEIRSSARHRDALRRVGQVAEPLPSLGLRFWMLQPAVAVCAYRVGVRTRVSMAAAPLVAQAEAERAVRRAGRELRRSRTGLWSAAAFAAGLTAAVLATRTLPVVSTVRPNWWLGGAAGATIVFAVIALATGRRTSQRTTTVMDTSVPVIQTPPHIAPHIAPHMAPHTAPVDAEVAVETVRAPVEVDVYASAQTPAPVAPQTGLSTDNAAATATVPAQASAPTTMLSATGEFRVLTAPEHYGRNGVGKDINAAMGTSGTTPSLLARSDATRRTEATRRATPKRSGIPDEARAWIAECLQSEQTPTGPEIGRRFRVDPSTGRRWIRQVRETL